MKIIQIIVSDSTTGNFSSYAGMIHSDRKIYGLGDDGKLYYWGLKAIGEDDENKKQGWILLVDELKEYRK